MSLRPVRQNKVFLGSPFRHSMTKRDEVGRDYCEILGHFNIYLGSFGPESMTASCGEGSRVEEAA